MGRQKYFLAVYTKDNKYITVDNLLGVKLSGQKTIDKFTSNYKKEDLIKVLNEQLNINAQDIKLEYRQDEKSTYYYGVITDNPDFKECLNKLKSNKNGDYIPKNSNIFQKEFNELEILVKNNLDSIKEIYGYSSAMYARASNYLNNKETFYEERDLLRDEFSKYINFRKWLVKEEKPIHIIKEEYRQMHINDYDLFDRIPKLIEEEKEEVKEIKEEHLFESDKEYTVEEREKDISKIKKFNRKFDDYEIDKEEFLTIDDFEKTNGDSVEAWEPKKRGRKN